MKKSEGFGYISTVKEFYEHMRKAGKENYQICVQYRDDGGDYSGEDTEIRMYIDDKAKTVTL